MAAKHILRWCCIALFVANAAHGAAPRAKNVVLIGVDDLRPDIAGPYGQTQVKTPSLDHLAASGTTFLRAYCQVALCSPSRTSLLTGLRPDFSKVWTIGPYFRHTMGAAGASVVTLPQHFRMSGFETTGAGKIFHPGSSSGGPAHGEGGGDGGFPFQANGSWSKPYFFCDQFYNGTLQSPVAQHWPGAAEENAGCIQSPECITCLSNAGSLGGKHAYKSAPCQANCYPDGAVADEAVRQLKLKSATPDQRFFLAIGFKRPHLGWMAPEEYFNMYNVSDVAIAKHRAPPAGMPAPAWSGNGEVCGMDDVTCQKVNGYSGIVPDSRHADLRRAYYAVVSFMDSQLGRVLDALDDTGLRSSTAVILWGDHGYQLGEHGIWCKITNFELATRVPLIVSIPGQPNPGSTSMALVEHLDIYPTCADIAGISIPSATMGRSLVPLIETPHISSTEGPWNASYSQITRGAVMGFSMRTDRWRITRWGNYSTETGRPDFVSPPVGVELYDHANDTEADFDVYENINLALDPAHAETVAQLLSLLESTWDNGHLPPTSLKP